VSGGVLLVVAAGAPGVPGRKIEHRDDEQEEEGDAGGRPIPWLVQIPPIDIAQLFGRLRAEHA